MRFFPTLLSFGLVALLLGCANSPDYNVRTRIASQVRILENVPYEAVHKAAVKTARSEQLKVKTSDPSKGLILATYANTEKDTIFMSALGSHYRPVRGEVVEFVINLEKLDERKTRARLSLQRIQSYNLLGNHEGEELMDFAAYRSFYDKLQNTLIAKYPKMEIRTPLSDTKKKKKATSPVTGKEI